jgi:hypothetical protein
MMIVPTDMTMTPTYPYRSYLVRFWQSNEQGSWRASAQCVQTGGTRLFGDVPGLLAFLHNQILGEPEEDRTEDTAKIV